MPDVLNLPEDLPRPVDDGACNHLPGKTMPSITLRSTANRMVNAAEASRPRAVFFFYPRTGEPGKPTPPSWDQIPGARGCTPQNCAYRDRFPEFGQSGFPVFGVSAQTTEYQQEFVARMKIPYEILSDEDFLLTEVLRLPTFVFESMRLIKRMALVTEAGRIVKVFYPVFPPDKNAEEVLAWLRANRKSS